MSLATLEAALANAPDDPLVLAAFADALTDAGDPRGDFLRLQAAVDKGSVDRAAGEKELRKLWRANAGGWSATSGGRIGYYTLEGACPVARLWALADRTAADLAAGPARWLVRGVWVVEVERNHSWRVAFGRLFDALVRSRVHTLRVGVTVGDGLVDLLLDSGFYGRLTELYLPDCGVTDHAAEALAADSHTPRLKVLDLDSNQLSHVGVGALAAVGVSVSDRQYFLPGGWDFDPPAFPDAPEPV